MSEIESVTAPDNIVVTVSAQTIATVSDRVDFNSQFAEFYENPETNQITLTTRANIGGPTYQSAKAIALKFDKNIEQGVYSVTDPGSPFKEIYYGETGVVNGLTRSFTYHAKIGTFRVEISEVTSGKLHYQFKFDFTGVNTSNEELKIAGNATYIVMLRPV